MYTNLPITEEVKALRVYYAHNVESMKNADSLSQPELDELTALQAYISIRLVNLKQQLSEQ